MINIMGSVSINFGTNLMKLSHNDRDRRAKEEALRELKEAGVSTDTGVYDHTSGILYRTI